MKRVTQITYLCLAVALCGLVFLGSQHFIRDSFAEDSNSAEAGLLRTEPLILKKRDGEELHFVVEIAKTSAEQERGLMFREHMPRDHGMLFTFNNERKRAFWMKDTLIPLDILFISKNGRIHHVHHMARPLDETHVTAQLPAFAVLEINGGLADELGIGPGDILYHDAFRNMNLLAP
jgi:uncharacterized membrane protein (UPF0127 family)